MAHTYSVEIQHQGTTHTIAVPEDETVLSAAQAQGLELPYSCSAGVCTTCAAKLQAGTVEQSEAMGINKELQEQGFALLCVAYPRSDLRIDTEQEDIVYELQFGQFQKK